MRIWTLLAIVGLITSLTHAEGPATQPATQPTTQPAKLADLSPDVVAILKPIGEAYAKAKSLDMEGTLVFTFTEGGKPRERKTTFTSWYLAPGLFKHEAKDQPTLGSNGAKVYGYYARDNKYELADAPKEKGWLSDLPEDHAKIIPMQNLSLVLALSKDPVEQLRRIASTVGKADDVKIGDKAFPAFSVTLTENGAVAVVAVDPQTHLIRRVTMDMTANVTKRGRTDIKDAKYVVDYTSVKVDPGLNVDQFAWVPPSGAKDLANAADDENDEHNPGDALVGKPAPNFTLKDMDGKDVTLADLKGSVVILDFWATWCGPCVASMPGLNGLYEEQKKNGLKVYAVNLRETKDKAEPFMKDKNLSLPVLFDTKGDVAKLYMVQGIPSKYVIGKDGTVRKCEVGFNPDGMAEFAKFIEEELKKK